MLKKLHQLKFFFFFFFCWRGGNHLSLQNGVQRSEVDYFCRKFHKENVGIKIFSLRPLVHKICPKKSTLKHCTSLGATTCRNKFFTAFEGRDFSYLIPGSQPHTFKQSPAATPKMFGFKYAKYRKNCNNYDFFIFGRLFWANNIM